jgi:hypothetical protein
MTSLEQSGFFGIKHSNRDFTDINSWGKNQFNSSFPAALACYMNSKNLKANYIYLNKKNLISNSEISFQEIFGIDPTSEDIFFAFETVHTPYEQFLIGNIPRIDLVIQNRETGNCLAGLEVKLTALPDNSTCDLLESEYGCEIVIRPDTIVYLACSIVRLYKNDLEGLNKNISSILNEDKDWSNGQEIIDFIPEIVLSINSIIVDSLDSQTPFILQPIWKTEGKSPKLSNNCLDIFVWSNIAFTKFIVDFTLKNLQTKKITRQNRTLIWLFKMIQDFGKNGSFNHQKIIDGLSYNTKNDKAFSANGKITHQYMKSKNLTKPRIEKAEIKNIILGGGHKFLSPERRFDAIIFNSEGIFDD